MLLGLAAEHASTTNAANVSTSLLDVASGYDGLLGPGRLNANGDQKSGSYDLKQVVNGQFEDLKKPNASSDSTALSFSALFTFISGLTALFLRN